MAIAFATDVSQYCYAQGSTTYMCSLDAEAAFDGLPHAVLFSKDTGVIPDTSWQALYYWYQRMEFIYLLIINSVLQLKSRKEQTRRTFINFSF